MKRTIERLTAERTRSECDFRDKLEKINLLGGEQATSQTVQRLNAIIAEVRRAAAPEDKPRPERRKNFLRLIFKSQKKDPFQDRINEQLIDALGELSATLVQTQSRIKELSRSIAELFEAGSALTDAKDREWDALASNHVGMIFKSLEWRVDQMAAECRDAQLVMKKFILLRDKLHRLLSVLESKKLPPAALVKDILGPLEDSVYTGFENRFRGDSEEVKRQQEGYLSYFQKGDSVLDLGCGRGEFLSLLEERGVKAEGVDINGQMVEICLDKGLSCEKRDLLEKLAEAKDGIYSGIFSSQVIEHLPPAYLKRLVELSFEKLAKGGVLILETVNPASVFALVHVYFLDPSHRHPVHPQALKYLLESSGFEGVEIRYSTGLEREKLRELPAGDERTQILNENIDALNRLLYASPNYAAIGKKL